MAKKNCIIYTHYTFGIGHLQRAKVIANSLKKDFNVTLISSGAKLKNFKVDKDIEWVKLPGEVKTNVKLKKTFVESKLNDKKYFDERVYSIKSIIDKKNPVFFITEFYPFGNFRLKKTLPEILGYLKSNYPYCKIISSVRDLPVSDSENVLKFDFNSVRHDLDLYYDMLLVHSPKEFSLLGDNKFLKKLKTCVPISYTGFVVDFPNSKKKCKKNEILVAVGGGRDGNNLLDKIFDDICKRKFARNTKFTFVTGEFHKSSKVYSHPQIRKVCKFIPDLVNEYSKYGCVISMAGYNTVSELLATNTKSVLVPRKDSFEQTKRAQFASKNSKNIVLYSSKKNMSLLVNNLLKTKKTLNDKNWFFGAERTRDFLKDILITKEIKINSILSAIEDSKLDSLRKLPNFYKKNMVYVIGWGKAVDFVIENIIKKIPDSKFGGAMFLSKLSSVSKNKFIRLHSSHPFISNQNISNTKKIIEFISKLNEFDDLIVVSTGGGSAMLEYSENFTLNELKKINKALVLSDFDCRKINSVRKKISSVKSGKLLNYTNVGEVINLVVSDDVLSRGTLNAVKYVASGPTCPQHNLINFSIKRLSLENKVVQKINLSNKKCMYHGNIKNKIISDNLDFCSNVEKRVKSLGYETLIRKDAYFGSTKKISKMLINEFLGIQKNHKKFAYVCGGESTVKLSSHSGLGGRCQQLAAEIMLNLGNKKLSCICVSSDGIDYIKNSSGAYVSFRDLVFCKKNKIPLREYILKNNTYFLHKKLGGLIKGRNTGTNVGDVAVFFSDE